MRISASLKLLSAALLPVATVGATLAAIAITLTPTCAHAGTCGTCRISGKAGSVETIGLHQYCIPCAVTKPDQTIAFVDVPPERGGHRKLMAAFDPGSIGHPKRTRSGIYHPPDNGGPDKTGGSGTRYS